MLSLALSLMTCVAVGETPSGGVYRLNELDRRPVVDGVLDDDVWERALLLGPLAQAEPRAGQPASEATEVRVCYDARSLFVALSCFDRDPAGIRATQMQRDANLDPDDRVEILIDSFLDRRNAFWFQIGAAGSLGDALVTRNGSSFNKQWDGIFHGRARIDDRGWFAELEIPFATLNFDPTGTAWGFNLRRFIRRRGEEARWSSADPRISFFSVVDAGTLTGFEGLHQGLGLDLVPFFVAGRSRNHLSESDDDHLDVGLDAFYRLTPNVKLSLSLNTDFAETEVDDRRVNLTRFPLFFPEKRDFFLEDSGVFQFGSGEVVPFFSRRIGLDAQREKVDIQAALKLTGQGDRFSFGLLDARTDATAAVDEQNLFVGRGSFHLFEQSDIGVLATSGDPEGGGSAETYGVDFNWRTNSFRGDRNLRLSSYAVATHNDDGDDTDLAYEMRLSYPNDEIDWSVGAGVVERGFDPKLGFVARPGVDSYDSNFSYSPRLEGDVRQLEFSVASTWVTDNGGETESFEVEVQPFGAEFDSGDSVALELQSSREVLVAPFSPQSGVVIDAGDYTFERVRFEVESSDKRDVSILANYGFGEYFDGHAWDSLLALSLRANAHVLASGEWERTDANLPGGEFEVDVVRVRSSFLFSNDVAWTNFVQWDSSSESIGWNSRVWWIFTPGAQAFLLFNQGWDHASRHFRATSSDASFKIGVTLRL